MPTFTNPNPQITVVSANVLKTVTVVGTAGPTDAGSMTSFYEIELVLDNVSVMVRTSTALANNFIAVRNRTDVFSVPLGMDFNAKRIRFCVQAEADPTQVWRSSFVVMTGVNFSNLESDTTTVPVVPQTALATLKYRKLQRSKEEQARKRTIRVSNRSRYKLAKVHLDAARGVVFGPMRAADQFYTLGSNYDVHRMPKRHVGFLDKVAADWYGAGNEDMWWTIAYANGVIDPETDVSSGQAIVIPTNELLTKFVMRGPV
jgi:hypothetical protein